MSICVASEGWQVLLLLCECGEREVPEPWRKAEAVEACDREYC